MWKDDDDDDDDENDEDYDENDEEEAKESRSDGWRATSRQCGRSGAIGMRSIPIDNRIYGGKLAREGDGIRGCSSAREPGKMEASAPRQTLKFSLPLVPLSLFSFLYLFLSCRRSIFPIFIFYPLHPSSVLSLLLSSSFPFYSLIPISRFSGVSPLLSSVD